MIIEFATQLGYMAVALSEGAVEGLSFGHSTARAARQSLERNQLRTDREMLKRVLLDDCWKSGDLKDRLLDCLPRFAEGEEVDLSDVPLATRRKTDFQLRVITACRAIPWGETVSYGDLAAQVGHPGAARAVGTVMSKNRTPLLVPCHRVLASGGHLGGYSAPQGFAMKRRLLALEQQPRAAVAI